MRTVFARRIGLLAAVAATFAAPAVTSAHSLDATYQSRLPLVVYLVGAGLAVALSFAFVLLRDLRAEPPPVTEPEPVPVPTTGFSPEPEAQVAQLPRTASPLPALGLFGVASLATGLLLAMRRRRAGDKG